MTFWGVEVKPGKPFHHPPSDASGKRLHISQATLGIGTATTRSVVQCNVGESTPVLLCTLRPDTAESSQLNLEFEESDEVVFSVLGPLSVHLTGYYVQSLGNEMEPHGEDTANTDHELSVDSGNEDDDSFINDGDPGIIPSSPDFGDEGKVGHKEVGEVEKIINKDEPTKLKQKEFGEEIMLSVDDDKLKSCLPKCEELTSKDEARPKEEMVSEVVKPFEVGVQDCSLNEVVMGLSAPGTKQEKANEEKSRKRKKHGRLEAKDPIIERVENDGGQKQDEVKVVNLEQPMFNEENEKQADDESGSVGKSEKKKRKKRKRHNRSHQEEKAEAVPE